MDSWVVVGLMLLRVVGVDGVSHIGRDEEALSNGGVVVLLGGVWLRAPDDSLASLNDHVAVSSLSRGGTDLLVVEEHDHADLLVVEVALLLVVDDGIQG